MDLGVGSYAMGYFVPAAASPACQETHFLTNPGRCPYENGAYVCVCVCTNWVLRPHTQTKKPHPLTTRTGGESQYGIVARVVCDLTCSTVPLYRAPRQLRPPSTNKIVPVIAPAFSEARNIIASAISRGSAMRPIGCVFLHFSRKSPYSFSVLPPRR